jgi:hypothetical protein
MRRLVAISVAALAACFVLAGQARPASHTLVLKLGIEQHGTTRTPHPPLGDAGDVFTTTLLLNNTAAALGKGSGASVGAMLFSYVLHGTCSTESCAGATADITATSRFPGGTVIAIAKGVKLGRPPIVIQITKGTGTYKGATGEVTIGAASSPFNTYRIVLP